jgi:hypothetical protein
MKCFEYDILMIIMNVIMNYYNDYELWKSWNQSIGTLYRIFVLPLLQHSYEADL